MAIFVTALSFKKYSSDERLESLSPTDRLLALKQLSLIKP